MAGLQQSWLIKTLAKLCYSESLTKYGHWGKRALKGDPPCVQQTAHIDHQPKTQDFALDPRDDFKQDRPQPTENLKTITIGDKTGLMDAYSGYNQIHMDSLDEEKTAFMTENANYCYTTMLFGLKNVGATYQRLMDKVFDRQIGRIMEVYVDDSPY